MRTRTIQFVGALFAVGAMLGWLAIMTAAQEKKPEAGRITESKFTEAQLAERTTHRCAVDAVVWGTPAVNAQLMYQAVADVGGDFNQVVYWSRLLNWKNQTLTPNPDTIYVFPFFNTKDVGPMVLEIPPAEPGASITGSIDNAWQVALEDVGPAGVDKGKGGKYLILPPGYKEKAPEGYIGLPCETYTGFVILRSNVNGGSEADIANAVAYGKRIKFYPLAQTANPPDTKFVDSIDKLFDSTIPYDIRYYQALDRFVQREPWLERDKVMIDTLKAIGIEKGKPFNPDEKTKEILADAAREAHAWLDLKYETVFTPPFNEGTHWALPAMPGVAEGMMTNFAKSDAYAVEGRGVAYSMAYFSAKHLGTGQYYLMTIVDKAGKPLDGAGSYRLNVPANAPVKLYWSATVYDRATHGLIRDMNWASRSSNAPGLEKNVDGSVDIYFGPKAPAGKESNWIPTSARGKFEVLFRLYGPEKTFFDKTWKLLDIEMAQ